MKHRRRQPTVQTDIVDSIRHGRLIETTNLGLYYIYVLYIYFAKSNLLFYMLLVSSISITTQILFPNDITKIVHSLNFINVIFFEPSSIQLLKYSHN